MKPNAGMVESAADEASTPFIDHWQILVSTTNWEKGQIIHEWRQALKAGGARPQQFSDETWSRRVGGVTSQHVGRLRRVYERFADQREAFAGLSWSHFLAAVEWPDAEMWLEGAVRTPWSVAEMRRERWQAMGAVEADRPREADVVASEPDEDVPAELVDEAGAVPSAERGTRSSDADARADAYDTADEVEMDEAAAAFDEADADAVRGEPMAVRPFAELPDLPPDVEEAFEAFKLVILRHKLSAWTEIQPDDMLSVLDSLKELVTAASGED